MVGTFGIACAVDPRTTIEGFYFKARVVGKDVHVVVVPDVARFYHGVLLKGVGIFGNFVVATDVGEGKNFELIAQNAADFVELVTVVRGEYYFHLQKFLLSFHRTLHHRHRLLSSG